MILTSLSRPAAWCVGAVLLAVTGVPALASPPTAPSAPPVLDPRLMNTLGAATVFVHAASTVQAEQAVAVAGLRLLERWDRIDAVVAHGSGDAVRRAAEQPGVTFVEAHVPVTALEAHQHIATRADVARDPSAGLLARPQGKRGKDMRGKAVQRVPYDGSGVTIAVNDFGIDGQHPAFVRDGRSKVVRSLTYACIDPVLTCEGFSTSAAVDRDGHGTAVAGAAAAYPGTTPDGRTVRGAAPGASLVSLADNDEYGFAHVSALHWVLQNHRDPCGDSSCPPIRVVTNSWGHVSEYVPNGGNEFDPRAAAARLSDALVSDGVVVTFAVGNEGDCRGLPTCPAPGTTRNQTLSLAKNPTPGVLGVADYDGRSDGLTTWGRRDGVIAATSSRGFAPDPTTYPDLAAPGTDVTLPCSSYQPRCVLSFDGARHSTLFGTSFAAPYVSGLVALLLQADPTLTPADIEHVLEQTARTLPSSTYVDDPRHPGTRTSFDGGHGLVDVASALASVLGRETPPERCVGSLSYADPAGDATAVVAENGYALVPSDPGLDVVGASVSTGADGDLLFSVDYRDLGPGLPASAPGQAQQIDFLHRGVGYSLHMERTRTASTPVHRFHLQRADRSIVADDLDGTIDHVSDRITVVLPQDALARFDESQPVLRAGEVLSAFNVVTARFVGTRPAGPLFVNADYAGSDCPYVVGR